MEERGGGSNQYLSLCQGPSSNSTARNTKRGVAGFYLHGADRRSRHSDSHALGKQAGRFGGRTHAQGPKHTYTHNAIKEVGKKTDT